MTRIVMPLSVSALSEKAGQDKWKQTRDWGKVINDQVVGLSVEKAQQFEHNRTCGIGSLQHQETRAICLAL